MLPVVAGMRPDLGHCSHWAWQQITAATEQLAAIAHPADRHILFAAHATVGPEPLFSFETLPTKFTTSDSNFEPMSDRVDGPPRSPLICDIRKAADSASYIRVNDLMSMWRLIAVPAIL